MRRPLLVMSTAAPFMALLVNTRPSVGAPFSGPDLRPARHCAEVRERVLDVLVEEALLSYRYRYRNTYPRSPRRRGAVLQGAASAKPVSAGDRAAGPSHHSTTNVQERGVDEADLVKTDGKHIYAVIRAPSWIARWRVSAGCASPARAARAAASKVYGSELLVLRTWPASKTSIVARHRIDGATARQLFLKGDRLAVFSSVHLSIPYPQPLQHQRGLARHRHLLQGALGMIWIVVKG